MRSRAAVSLLPAVVLLAACGTNGGPTTQPTTTPGAKVFDTGDYKRCSEVWMVGKTLPKDYPGCVESDGVTIVDGSALWCTPPGEPIRTLDAESYDRRLIAELGGEITEDPERAQRLEDELSKCKASAPD